MTETEIRRVGDYMGRVLRGGTFTPEEATDFQELAARVAEESPGEDWAVDLVKVAFIVYAIDAVGPALAPTDPV